MKVRILLISAFLIVGLIVIFNLPVSKSKSWTTELINGYIIEKKSEDDIKLKYKYNNKYIDVVPEYVAEYSYGEKYILLKCIDNSDGIAVKFYIIDTVEKMIYGPYDNYELFNSEQNNIVDEKVSDYVKTIDKE